MSSVVISGNTSGAITLSAPAIAGSNTITLPAGTGTAAVQGVSSNLVLGTAKNATGLNVDFSPVDNTGIPSWAKRVTVMFNAVSTNGSSIIQVQLGTSTGIDNSNYNGTLVSYNQTAAGGIAYTNTSGIYVRDTNISTASWYGIIRLTNFNANIWITEGSTNNSTQGSCAIIYYKSLLNTLDRIRITTVNGADSFRAGTINVMYE